MVNKKTKNEIESEEENPFLKPSNYWRFIGGFVGIIGLVGMIFYPSESHRDIIIYQSLDDKGQINILVTIWHILILFGSVTLLPTLKEFLVKMKNR